jgi:hypothetical protein
MSLTTSYGYTNVTDGQPVTPPALGAYSNYATVDMTATTAILSNKTAPIGREEIMRYHARSIPSVDTSLTLQNPSKVKGGVLYSVKNEAVLTTTDSDDPNFRIDEPIICNVQIWHPKSGNITPDLVAKHLLRTIAGFRHDDGSWRFDDMMRLAEKPQAD